MRPVLFVLVVFVIGASSVLRLIDPVFLTELRHRIFDFYLIAKPRVPHPQTPVTIVDIDEKSIEALGQFPWSRRVLAALLDELHRGGARAVAFDVVFSESDRTSMVEVVRSHRDVLPSVMAEYLASFPSNEDVMAQSMQNIPTVLGMPQGFYGTRARRPSLPSSSILPADMALIQTFIEANHLDWLRPNVPVLSEAARGFGVFSLRPESDGVLRRVPLLIRVDDQVFPSISLELLRVGFGVSNVDVHADAFGIKGVVLRPPGFDLFIPTDEQGRLWLNYARPDVYNTPDNRGRYYVSAIDVLARTLPPGRLEGQFVLIGASAVGLNDLRSAPVSPAMPGVEIHAHTLEAIIEENHLQAPGYFALLEVLFMVLGALMAVWFSRYAIFFSATALGLFMGGQAYASWYGFVQFGTLFDSSLPIATTLLVYFLMLLSNYARERRAKAYIENAFQHYLSPDLVRQLSASPARLKLGGEVRSMTFLFCDIRNFTAISETYKNNPQGLTELVNQLLTPLTGAILEHRGTIDKYMGDCIMAFWNAPLDDPEHQRHAALAALAIQLEIKKLNDKFAAQFKSKERNPGHKAGQDSELRLPSLGVGIGINSGEAVVGNMGSTQRFDYSVLGDAVNLASRLESQSKTYGVPIVLGEDTCKDLTDLALLELDLIAVQGKQKAVRAYGLLGDATLRASSAFQDLAALNEKMLQSYRQQNWTQAETYATQGKVLLDGTMDFFYNTYLERMRSLRQARLPADWDGVFYAQTK